MAATGKRGRPHKGDRKPVYVRMPRLLAERLEAEARSSGQDTTEWIVELIASRLQYPINQQEHLPLADSAA
jgi:hypothetical protein